MLPGHIKILEPFLNILQYITLVMFFLILFIKIPKRLHKP